MLQTTRTKDCISRKRENCQIQEHQETVESAFHHLCGLRMLHQKDCKPSQRPEQNEYYRIPASPAIWIQLHGRQRQGRL